MDSLVMAAPPEQRARVREVLAPNSRYSVIDGRTPNAKRLVARLRQLRSDRDSLNERADSRKVARAASPMALVALVGALPDGAAVQIRRRRAGRSNLLLVTTATTPLELALALDVLQNTRREFGDKLKHEARISVRSQGSAAGQRVSTKREVAAELLAELVRAPMREIPGIGQARITHVRLGRILD